MVGRPRGSRKKAESEETRFKLLDALEFISVTQLPIGEPNQTHCTMAQHEVVGFNGVIAAGHPIDEDFSACPNTIAFLKSLRGRPTTGMSLTQLGDGRLVVTAPPFRSVVPVVPFGSLSYARPDPMIAPATDALKEALAVCTPIVNENAQQVALASIHSINGAFQAADKTVAIEAWHNISFPPGLLIPKKSADIILKIKQPIIGFGHSETSLTLHYDGGLWFKTQLYQANYVNFEELINVNTQYFPASPAIFTAVNAIADLSAGRVYFEGGEVRTNAVKGEGASYSAFGLPEKRAFDIKLFRVMEPYATHLDFNTQTDRVKFYGKSGNIVVRGIIMGMKWPEEEFAAEIGTAENRHIAEGTYGDEESGDE